MMTIMSDDAHEELYRVLLATAEECPLLVLANIMQALVSVMSKRVDAMAAQIALDVDENGRSSLESHHSLRSGPAPSSGGPVDQAAGV